VQFPYNFRAAAKPDEIACHHVAHACFSDELPFHAALRPESLFEFELFMSSGVSRDHNKIVGMRTRRL
jgi:hypothetical protein